MLEQVKRVILILSGKGGVGKSTVSTQLALTLKEKGFKVGLLDIDLCGPSVPYILNLEGQNIHQGDDGWIPVYLDQEQKLGVMSIGFLLNSRNDAVVWRGPKKTSMIKQFLEDVCWQDLDYLVIDTPPGTSDEHITVMENLRQVPQCSAILVTTPQEVAIEDVRKEITFCRKTGIPIMGIIENMSGYECPVCSECTNIFSSDGGKSLAEISKIPFLGCIPIDPRVGALAGRGVAAVKELPDSKTKETDHVIEVSDDYTGTDVIPDQLHSVLGADVITTAVEVPRCVAPASRGTSYLQLPEGPPPLSHILPPPRQQFLLPALDDDFLSELWT